MRIFDRFLLFIVSVGLLKLAIIHFLIGLGVLNRMQLLLVLKYIYEAPDLRWIITVVSFVLFLVGCHLLVLVFRRAKAKDQGVDQLTEVGPICVSFEAIQSLALNAARQVRNVREVIARVRYQEEDSALSIKIRVVIDGQNPIKDITEQVQQNVKEQVEKIAGISVSQVSVYVDQVIRPDRSRVRVQ